MNLNTQRDAEEAQGRIRWLRPAYHFQRKPVKAVSTVLEALEAMNLARREEGFWRLG